METVLLIAAETVSEQPQHLQLQQRQLLQRQLLQLQLLQLQLLQRQLQQRQLLQRLQHRRLHVIVNHKDVQINVVFHAADLQAVANV
jgi:hypothetical protein